jgi:predicted phosphate transport protein (TIGR00153 family)
MEFRILKKRLDIGRQFDDFLDKVSEAGLLFKTGVDAYLSDNMESFEKKIEDIVEIEHGGDALRRDLEETLYVQTLIPESRGDVLELLENMDGLLDRFKGALWQFNIERPELFLRIYHRLQTIFTKFLIGKHNLIRSHQDSSKLFSGKRIFR